MVKKKETIKRTSSKKLVSEYDIAYDFATKIYQKFDKIIKSIVLFGSTAKKTRKKGSDIDLILIVDDCVVNWDEELVAWYREELGRLIRENPYSKSLHINTVKLSTWWAEVMRGDPTILNIIRYGQALIDFGGFFNPLKVLLAKGKIKSTPESIYVLLQRAPTHLLRTKSSLLNSIEGMYWAMVDSAQAALIAAKRLPPSTEHISELLKQTFPKMLEQKYIDWYKELYLLSHDILHGKISEVTGSSVEIWQKRTDEFIGVMARIINRIIK
ncbi:MAG: nucleotidyltransferase domain-containing protein [archaeon]